MSQVGVKSTTTVSLTTTKSDDALNRRTNNALVQTFTVAGTTTSSATNVTVAANGGAATAAIRFADATFARTNVTLVNGTNTFTAVAGDSLGRWDTNTVNAYLPTAVTFLYDQNGNLRTNGTRIFEYDDENQLTTITEPSAWKTEYAYDGKMRMRVSKDYEWRNGGWVMTNEVHRVYDGMLVLQERDQFNVPKLTYTRGKDLSGSLESAGGIGGLLALSDHSTLNSSSSQLSSFYFHSDGNGNVTALVDTNQNVVARYLFDPFGNTLSATGPKADLNKYRFSSKEAQSQSGLVYYGYRFYEPNLQRWPNRDPLGELGFEWLRGEEETQGNRNDNLYRFVRNDPLYLIDPLGLSPLSDCMDKARQNALDCAKKVRKWCGDNIYHGRLEIIEGGMNCSGGGISGIVKKAVCLLLKAAVRGLRGGGTVAGVVGGTAVCDVSYKAEVDACYTVHGPVIRPGPKF